MTDVNNYRGISIIPILEKLFEKILSEQINHYFDSNKLFYAGQHGFRKGHSWETALHELLSDLNIARDERKTVLLLFIDFRKAFDTVDSSLLIQKLPHYGFDNDSLRLISSYFCNRKQLIKRIDGKENLFLDKSRAVNLVVWGSTGKLPWPTFFSHLHQRFTLLLDLAVKLFADDTTLYLVGDELSSLVVNFNKRLTSVFDWCATNRIDINWKKTFAMFVTNKRVLLPSNVLVNGVSVEVVSSFKLLGVILDNRLSFSSYAVSIYKSVNQKLFSIKKIFLLVLKFSFLKVSFFLILTFVVPYLYTFLNVFFKN